MIQKKFNTTFSTHGWGALYITTVIIALFMWFVSIPISHAIKDVEAQTILNLSINILQWIITAFFMCAVYSKLILHFVNTLSLDNKKFSTKLNSTSFFTFILANVIISIFTLGIYIPWAYKAMTLQK